MRSFSGDLDAGHLRIAVIAGRFNETISRRLVDGALDCLRRHGAAEDDIWLVWVPGAFELPMAARSIAVSKEVDAIVCLGAVVRGETPHFDYVAGSAARGIADAMAATGIPIAFGVLTTDDSAQAEARAGGKAGNKGFEAALAAIEMANLLTALPKPAADI
ncbi:MAG: 6,7-dimethyl-8-ribityllumazine synthase [Actinobacteria bacterium]|nr:6,7-dimethyl-8-ribityllumazine synthase [Actinomycetota bacterium]